MREDQYRLWLEANGISRRPISDYISRNKRIENCLDVDLDNEYLKDGGRQIIDNFLSYENMQNASIKFNITGTNIKKSIASLRSAANSYFEFCIFIDNN